MEGVEPVGGVVADPGSDAVEQVDGLRAAGEDGQGIIQAVEPELRDHRVQPLLDQELPGLWRELLAHQREFSPREAEAFDIVPLSGVGVRKEDLRRALLEDRVSNRRAQDIGGGLGAEHHEGVLLAVGLQAILGETAEGLVP
jgi:hypothetical protein